MCKNRVSLPGLHWEKQKYGGYHWEWGSHLESWQVSYPAAPLWCWALLFGNSVWGESGKSHGLSHKTMTGLLRRGRKESPTPHWPVSSCTSLSSPSNEILWEFGSKSGPISRNWWTKRMNPSYWLLPAPNSSSLPGHRLSYFLFILSVWHRAWPMVAT